jgi:hypothetical protein
MDQSTSVKHADASATKRGKLLLIIALLTVVLIALGLRFGFLRRRYYKMVAQTIFHQEKSGVSFRIIAGDPQQTLMVIGDIVGTNFFSAQVLSKIDPFPEYPGRKIIVTRIKPQQQTTLTAESLLAALANEKGVVLSDNFCIASWDNIKSKNLYQGTHLSPGPFCFSEPATLTIDNLLKQYQVSRVVLFYDIPAYKAYLSTFTTYLRENKIPYEIRDIQTVTGGVHAEK